MSQTATRKKIRVLIADDHEMVRAGLRSLLESELDIEIVGEAGTGSQTLTQARRLQPEVVLLDARLPDMPGWDVCHDLCEAFPDIAVAILTTFTDDELVRQCVRAGARGYLLKEIPGFDLISYGGLPQNRSTLLSGTSGSAKTVMACAFAIESISAAVSCGKQQTVLGWSRSRRPANTSDGPPVHKSFTPTLASCMATTAGLLTAHSESRVTSTK